MVALGNSQKAPVQRLVLFVAFAQRQRRGSLAQFKAKVKGVRRVKILRLRADELIKDTLVLMLTAKGRDTDVDKGLGVGADAYMTKPFSTKELVAKVAQMLDGAP